MAEDFSWIGGGGSLVGKSKKQQPKAMPTQPQQIPQAMPTQPQQITSIPTGSNTQQTAQGLGQMQTYNLPNATMSQPRTETTPVNNIIGTPSPFGQQVQQPPPQQQQQQQQQPFDMASFFNQLKGLITPQKTEIPQYVDPYAQQRAEALSKFQTALNTPFQYDPSQDVGLKSAQQQAQQQTLREFARKNLLGSMSNEAQAQLAAMNLIPQYQREARQGYNENLSNLAENLGLMQGLSKESYGRHRDVVGDVNMANTQEYNRAADLAQMALGQSNIEQNRLMSQLGAFGKGINPITGKVETTPEELSRQQETMAKQKESMTKQQEAIRKQETQTYGVGLSDMSRTQMSSYKNLFDTDMGFRNDILNNWNNLAVLRDKYRAIGDEEAVQAVEGARLDKILSDPVLLEQYGKGFGLSSSDIKNRSMDLYKKQIELNKAEAEALEAQYDANIKELTSYMKSIDASSYDYKTRLDISKAEKDLENKNIDNFMKNIEASYIDRKLKQDLFNSALQAKNIQDQINNRNANLKIAQDREKRLSQEKTNWKSKFAVDLAEDKIAISENPIAQKTFLENESNKKAIIDEYGSEYYAELLNALRSELSKVQNEE